jgi:acyl-coenzyme A thioesterase PaaI-like protein
VPPPERLSHHELCFGCGQANLFGLQLELARTEDGGVAGRFFVKQDHQGPPGYAHGGVLATALDEAMALLVHDSGVRALTRSLSVTLDAPALVGTYVEVSAAVVERTGRRLVLSATAGNEGGVLATAQGTFVEATGPREVD